MKKSAVPEKKAPTVAEAQVARKRAAKAAASPTASAPPAEKAPAKVKKAAAKPVVEVAAKPAKVKLVRDSFAMPSDEYAAIGALKQRALAASISVKKSELLRAGIKLLGGLSDAALLRALKAVPAIKTGRPKSKKGD